jgi:hypothetical protein
VESKSIIFLDLDNTLVCCRWDDGIAFPANKYKFLDNVMVVAPRPGLLEFMEAVKELGNLNIFTAANRHYAQRVVGILGIKKYFDEIYCLGEFTIRNEIGSKLNLSRRSWVLTDDCPPETNFKIAILTRDVNEGRENNYVHVKQWYPTDQYDQDNEFPKILKKIAEKLNKD